MVKKYTKSEIEGMIKNLKEKEKKARSKWGKAVLQDAQWLLENVIEGYDEPYELSEKLVLNGASDWKQFSWGGSALIYNGEIAEHYSTPSELKKFWGLTKDGGVKRDTNTAGEHLMDIQARALRQAWWAIRDEMNGTTEFSMSLCNFSYQDVEGHYAGTENFKVVENNKDRLVLETDTMRSIWTFDGNNVVKYETTDKTSGKKIESKDSTSYFKKSQGLTEEYKGNEKIATFKTPKRTYTYDFKVGKLIDEKGNPANAKDMGKLLSNESSEVCDNIRKSVNKIEDELKKYGHLKMAKKDEVFATIKDSLAKTNFSGKDGLKYRKTKGQGKDSYKGKKSNFSIDYIVEESCDLADFPAWSGGKDRLDEIIELGIEDEAEDYIKEMFYDETPTDTQINDILWFEMDDWIEEHRQHSDNFKIFNIEWDEYDIEDAKENDIVLPTELELENIEIEDRDDVKSSLSDAIYDEVGYSPNSFEYKSESGNFSIHELSAQHDARKSFYGKAQVNVDDKTGVQTLYLYGTKVAQYNPKTKKFTAFPEAKHSATTKRHVREFMKQNGVPASEFSIIDDTKDVLRATGKLAGNIVKDTLYNGGILMF